MAIHAGKPDPQALDASGHLQLDVACHRCGYLLRGLTLTSRCPECGVPVFLSLRGDRLINASPEWLTRVGVGIRIGQIAAIGLPLLVFPGTCLAAAIDYRIAGLGPAILVVWSFGVWRSTTPEPGRPVGRHRVMAAIVCVCTVIVQTVAVLVVWRGWQNVWGAIAALEWTCAVGLWLVQMVVAGSLARRATSSGVASVKVWTIIGLTGHGAVAAGMLAALIARAPELIVIVPMIVGAVTTWLALLGSANVFSEIAGALQRCAMVALADRQEAIQRDDPPNA